jgi:hypothetical protein
MQRTGRSTSGSSAVFMIKTPLVLTATCLHRESVVGSILIICRGVKANSALSGNPRPGEQRDAGSYFRFEILPSP